MRYVGSCPHCGARIDVALAPQPLVNCVACGRRSMPVLPEEEAAGSGGEVSIELLPFQEKAVRESWLAKTHLRRPVFFVVLAACAFGLALLVLGVLYLVAPDSRLTEWVTKAFAAVAGLFLSMPFSLFLSGVVVLVLFLRPGRRAIDAARSLLAVFVGFHIVLVVELVRSASSPLLPAALAAVTSLALLAGAGVSAGWVAARLAPDQPRRHVFGVFLALAFMLGLALMVAGMEVLWAKYLVTVPALCFGGWLFEHQAAVARSA